MTDDSNPTANEPTEAATESAPPPSPETADVSPQSVDSSVVAAAPAAPVPDTQAAPSSPAVSAPRYVWGTGRRKSAVARVRVHAGDGKFLINDRELKDFFRLRKDQQAVLAPLQAADAVKHVDILVNVSGGGISGQSEAIVLGLARALCRHNSEYEPAMRSGQFLTRDSRVVERKKYGQSGARRRFQFSKR